MITAEPNCLWLRLKILESRADESISRCRVRTPCRADMNKDMGTKKCACWEEQLRFRFDSGDFTCHGLTARQHPATEGFI